MQECFGMDNEQPGFMTPFDELVTTPELQIVKLLVPYAPASGRQVLAGMVKFMELREALRLFRGCGTGLKAQTITDNSRLSLPELLSSFRPYLRPGEAAILDMILNITEMMSLMEMMKTVQNPQGNSESSPSAADLLAAVLPPEQQEMFRMYSEMFSQSADSAGKGDEENEQRLDEQSGNKEYGSGEAGTDPDGS